MPTKFSTATSEIAPNKWGRYDLYPFGTLEFWSIVLVPKFACLPAGRDFGLRIFPLGKMISRSIREASLKMH